jgi:hypothetical protein
MVIFMKLFSGCHRVIFLIAILLCNPLSAYAGDYLTSAHGDSTLGVYRTSDNVDLTGYNTGNCAHCHEQHAIIDGLEPTQPAQSGPSTYMLFADTNPTTQNINFCLNCHKTSGVQTGGITNYNYSTTFGGQATGSTSTTSTIYDAFNPTAGSTHDLNQVYQELQNLYPTIYDANANPCVGCHNPHIARKNNGNIPSALPPLGATYDPSKAAISLPSDPSNLWGEVAAERMSTSALTSAPGNPQYRSPFYVGATLDPASTATELHEPDGVGAALGASNVTGATTPDYNTMCLECHWVGLVAPAPINAPTIPWYSGDGGNGAQHGHALSTGATNEGSRISPYTQDGSSGTTEDLTVNFVLSCLDCHEPHGAQHATYGEKLLRTTANGLTGITIGGVGNNPGRWYNLCIACHTVASSVGSHPAGLNANMNCSGGACHGHNLNF